MQSTAILSIHWVTNLVVNTCLLIIEDNRCWPGGLRACHQRAQRFESQIRCRHLGGTRQLVVARLLTTPDLTRPYAILSLSKFQGFVYPPFCVAGASAFGACVLHRTHAGGSHKRTVFGCLISHFQRCLVTDFLLVAIA